MVAPYCSNIRMISRLPDSAQSCSAVLPEIRDDAGLKVRLETYLYPIRTLKKIQIKMMLHHYRLLGIHVRHN